jgi:heme ABC exporter ATP-binding subunit CcmA
VSRAATDAEIASTARVAPAAKVSAQHITKRFGLRTVLRDVNLQIAAGETVVLFGANGAGKTTLLRILSTLSRPSRGSLEIDGIDVAIAAESARARIGVVAHQPYLYESLTAEENLRFFARMYDVTDAAERISACLRMVGLESRARDRVDTFSRGMQQRLALARAILHRPALLLLDEPDTGLDPEGIGVLGEIVAGHRLSGGGALLTTHDLEFGLRVSQRALVIVDGRLTLDRPAGEVSRAAVEQAMGLAR